jgi:hypothetical protein
MCELILARDLELLAGYVRQCPGETDKNFGWK